MTHPPPARTWSSPAFRVALGMLIAAFLADTATTLAGGTDMMQRDLNPLIRRLSPAAYILASIARLAIGVAILTVFWPRRLVMREWIARRGRWTALWMPLPYRSAHTYVPAVLVTAIGPLKLLAAGANGLLLAGGGPLPIGWVLAAGAALGLLSAQAIMRWHHG